MPSRITGVSPPDGIPEDSFKYAPLLHLRSLYISFVKGLFASAPVGAYHYSDDDETEIYISDEHPINAERIGMRPAISFTRGPIQFYSLGLDDMVGYDFHTGAKKKAVLIPGVMSVNCVARSDIECDNIAWVVAEHLWLLREHLLKQGFFEIGRQPQLSAPSPAGSIVVNDGGDGWYCTSVSSPFQFPRMSQFTPLNNTILKNIEMQFKLTTQRLRSNGWPAAPMGHEFPIQVHECPPTSFAPEASDTGGRTPDPAGLQPNPPPRALHPLNPTVSVSLRHANPHKPGIRPPSIGGRAIPIADPCVEESGAKSISSTTKV